MKEAGATERAWEGSREEDGGNGGRGAAQDTREEEGWVEQVEQ